MAGSSGEEICVVGYGAVLPEAADPDAFWSNLLAGRCSIRELPRERWDAELYCGTGGRGEETSCTHKAGFVDDRMLETMAAELGISPRSCNRLQIMALGAANQALSGLPPGTAAEGRTDVLLGCIEVDEGVVRRKFMAENFDSLEHHIEAAFPDEAHRIVERIRRHLTGWQVDPELHRSELFTSSVLQTIQGRFDIDGEAALVDAACASSLASIDAAIRVLRAGRADLVLAGGIESNLGPDTFVLFTRLGALSPDRCLPLDGRTAGLSQGEGAVVFVLERLEDAVRRGHPIHAVLPGSGGSSDGASGSLFEPTTQGQVRALRQAYADLDPGEVDYVECHATGTRVGDKTELQSMIRFFGERKLPIGSVKALIGHTKGTAGAASLLKCLLSLKHRAIPPSPYFRSSILDEPHGPFVNASPIRMRDRGRPLLCGVSAFGFGGINYHLVIQRHSGNGADRRRRAAAVEPRRRSAEPRPQRVVLVAQHTRRLAGVRNDARRGDVRIPPRSLAQIDELQIASLLAVAETLREIRFDPGGLDPATVSVVGASTIGLEAAAQLAYRVRHAEVAVALDGWRQDLVAGVLAHGERYPEVTEDSGPGILNNVLAGRVANYYDFTGPSLNIDADLASFPAALRLAQLWLASDTALVILLSAAESFDAPRFKVERHEVTCTLLSTLELAKAHNLPIQATLEGVRRASAA